MTREKVELELRLHLGNLCLAVLSKREGVLREVKEHLVDKVCELINEGTIALTDSSYIAGAKAGFNLGINENHEGLQTIIGARDGYLGALRRKEQSSD